MANYGLSMPWIAKLDVESGTYSGGFKCGEAVNTTVTSTYNEASLRGDNKEVKNVKKFKNATVVMGVTSLPLVAKDVMFGHEVDEEEELEVSRSGDAGNYVGYGFISEETLGSRDVFIACVLLKVLFAESEEAYNTEGDSITFSTPAINGTAIPLENGEWRKKKVFASEEEADTWIQIQLGIKSQVEKPVASVLGGEYGEAQSVTLTCGTEGATIKYTTDGTTPSQTNGTQYASTAVSITKNTGLRAIAYKAGSADSEIMTEEYFITA